MLGAIQQVEELCSQVTDMQDQATKLTIRSIRAKKEIDVSLFKNDITNAVWELIARDHATEKDKFSQAVKALKPTLKKPIGTARHGSTIST